MFLQPIYRPKRLFNLLHSCYFNGYTGEKVAIHTSNRQPNDEAIRFDARRTHTRGYIKSSLRTALAVSFPGRTTLRTILISTCQRRSRTSFSTSGAIRRTLWTSTRPFDASSRTLSPRWVTWMRSSRSPVQTATPTSWDLRRVEHVRWKG